MQMSGPRCGGWGGSRGSWGMYLAVVLLKDGTRMSDEVQIMKEEG